MEKQKNLFILRHAKSSWDEPEKDDFDRALKIRGINDIQLLARKTSIDLKDIELILSSPANRAIHTTILLAQTIGFPLDKVQLMDNLYETHEVEVEKLINALPNNLSQVMIVGHNPTLTYFANRYLKDTIFNIPTSGLVRLNFAVSNWEDVSKETLASSFFDFPKNHQ